MGAIRAFAGQRIAVVGGALGIGGGTGAGAGRTWCRLGWSGAINVFAGMVGDTDGNAGPALALLAGPYAAGAVLDIDGGGLLA